ncbi:MAG TPA: hypothetical protein VK063_11425 [Beutenbergiaceae bacterium]|nr:hypothetical protein [Beutenbergiaceae bacterium]
MAVQYFPMVARLADGTFEPSLPGQGGTVVHVGTADPAEISEDAAGEQVIPASRLEVGTDAPLVPGFFSLDDSHYLDWLADNGLRVPLFSPEGSAQAAQAAQEAVESLRAETQNFINTGGRIHILGTLDDAGELPGEPANPEDAWLIDGDIWVHTAADGWTNAGRIQGPKGETGDSGITWDELDHPDVFPPEAHHHPAGDITGTLDAARIPALPYRGSNWTPTADQVQGLDEHVGGLSSVVRLDEVELTGSSEQGTNLTIPTALRGAFDHYTITLMAGAEVAGDLRRVCVHINGDQEENYRFVSRAWARDLITNIIGSITTIPATAFTGNFLGGSATITLIPHTGADMVSWHAYGTGNMGGNPAEMFTFLTGGRYSGPTQEITHFQIATSQASQWRPGSTATLWGYR